MPYKNVNSPLERLAQQVVDSAFQVHQELGAGLLESSYEVCLAHELQSRGLNVKRQVTLPVKYKNVTLDAGYRLNLLCLLYTSPSPRDA